MTITHQELDLGTALFLELIQAEASLAPVVAEARREYFPPTGVFKGDPREDPAAEVRFFEWLLFERDYAGGLLVEHLLGGWREMATPELVASEESFLGTCAGMFEVGEPAGDDLYWLKDIAGLGEYAVEVRRPRGTVSQGDLFVGRLFPSADSVHILSAGAGYFREGMMLDAVARDLEIAREQSSHKALRIRQVDLEAMFWGPEGGERSSDPVSDLRSFLEAGGTSSDEIDGVMEVLAQRPIPEDPTDPLLVSALADLLDHLAFETEVDLSSAQKLFLACWLFLHTSTPVSGCAEPEDEAANLASLADPSEALAAFDSDRAKGLDAQAALKRMATRLGVEVDDTCDLDDGDTGSEIALVPGLIAEYLWDVGRMEGEEAAAQQASVQSTLAGLSDVVVFEELSPRRILLLGCTQLIEDPELSPEQGRAAAVAIGQFCEWCAENHGLELDGNVRPAFQSLPDSMCRIGGANGALSGETSQGELCRVEESNEALVAMDPDGVEHPLDLAEESMKQ